MDLSAMLSQWTRIASLFFFFGLCWLTFALLFVIFILIRYDPTSVVLGRQHNPGVDSSRKLICNIRSAFSCCVPPPRTLPLIPGIFFSLIFGRRAFPICGIRDFRLPQASRSRITDTVIYTKPQDDIVQLTQPLIPLYPHLLFKNCKRTNTTRHSGDTRVHLQCWGHLKLKL